MRAATQEFHIDGTWADPRMTRINRRNIAESASPDAAPGTGRSGVQGSN
jgi:hypothetical protein